MATLFFPLVEGVLDASSSVTLKPSSSTDPVGTPFQRDQGHATPHFFTAIALPQVTPHLLLPIIYNSLPFCLLLI